MDGWLGQSWRSCSAAPLLQRPSTAVLLPVPPQVDLKDKAHNLVKYRLSDRRRSPHSHISDADWAAIQVGASRGEREAPVCNLTSPCLLQLLCILDAAPALDAGWLPAQVPDALSRHARGQGGLPLPRLFHFAAGKEPGACLMGLTSWRKILRHAPGRQLAYPGAALSRFRLLSSKQLAANTVIQMLGD